MKSRSPTSLQHPTLSEEFWAKLPTKIGTSWNKNQEVLQAWSNRGSSFFFFLQNKNRLHSALVVQFSFGQPSHKSFFRNVRLCWGSWPYLSPIFLGRVVVGVWTKMIDQLEETSPELFFSFCSNKLEASQALENRCSISINTIIVSGIFFLHIFHPIFRSELDKKLPSLPSFRQNKHAWGVIINGKRYWL